MPDSPKPDSQMPVEPMPVEPLSEEPLSKETTSEERTWCEVRGGWGGRALQARGLTASALHDARAVFLRGVWGAHTWCASDVRGARVLRMR